MNNIMHNNMYTLTDMDCLIPRGDIHHTTWCSLNVSDKGYGTFHVDLSQYAAMTN